MTDWAALISNLGFPIAITLYVLIRMENTIRKNTEAIIQLAVKIGEIRIAK